MKERGAVLVGTIIFTALLLSLLALVARFTERALFSARSDIAQLRAIELDSAELVTRGTESLPLLPVGQAPDLPTQTGGSRIKQIELTRADPPIPNWEEILNLTAEHRCPPGGCYENDLELSSDQLFIGDLDVAGTLNLKGPITLVIFGSLRASTVKVSDEVALLSPSEIEIGSVIRDPELESELFLHSSSTLTIALPLQLDEESVVLSALESASVGGIPINSPSGPVPGFALPLFVTRAHLGTILGEAGL